MRIPAFLLRPCLALLLTLPAVPGMAAGLLEGTSSRGDPVIRADAILADLPYGGAMLQQRLLTAAMLYANGQAYAKATETLNRIDTQQLDPALRGDFLVTSVDAALGSGDTAAAMRVVSRPPAGAHAFIDELSALDYARVAERRARVHEKRGLPVDAIRERVLAAQGLPADARRANADALWALLLRTEIAALKPLADAEDSLLAGWASLALAWRDVMSGGTRAERVEAWLAGHADHPAAVNLPPAVTQMREAAKAIPLGPKYIAVILPQHGKLAPAGTALQRGILAAWFQARENGLPAPLLQFFDSSRSDFLATYDAAVASGAQLVIGPLEKENLRLLQQRGNLPVATLALNYPDADSTAVSGLFYFGLAGEDEAVQVASAALADGLRRAAILYPEADWGQRIARQFEQALQAGGGLVQARGAYQGTGDYGDVVRRLMDANASEQRHLRLERLLGIRLGFQPGRRQDIDFLFVIANTPQAVQLAPAVQYHYGAGLPVLATSHVNSQSGANDAGDLDGIRFVDMPWVIDTDDALFQQVKTTWQDIDERHLRLYALGVDAFRVSQQLPRLLSSPLERLPGVTGTLSMDTTRRIHRQLSWMVFRDRQAQRVDAAE